MSVNVENSTNYVQPQGNKYTFHYNQDYEIRSFDDKLLTLRRTE
ncbi:2627_t:CDS:1, partial [Dentiscutata heterogama]